MPWCYGEKREQKNFWCAQKLYLMGWLFLRMTTFCLFDRWQSVSYNENKSVSIWIIVSKPEGYI